MSANLSTQRAVSQSATPETIGSAAINDPCTMGQLLLRAISRGGNRLAFVSQGEPVSYAEFGQRLSRCIQALQGLGVERGVGVACLAGNTIEAYLVTAAAYFLGARITNLHPMGSADDHAYIVGHCAASLLLFDSTQYADRAREILARMSNPVEALALDGDEGTRNLAAMAAAFASAPLVDRAHVDDACFLVYTGGTTGKPKGVVHTHRTFVAVMMAELAEWEWPECPVFLAVTPISHGAGPCIVPVLLRGGTVVLESGFTPARFLELVERHRVSATFLVPTMIYKVLDHLADAPARSTTLRMVIYGAAPMAPARLREALRVFGPVFMQLYGQSEAPNCITVLRRADHDPDHFPERLASCGTPIASNCVALLDEKGTPVADGEVGEICVRGPLVMAGYWNDPEETSKAFRNGWLYTGDLARRDAEGYLFIVGRSKDMIITGGFNVYPAEVEDVVCAHPAVSAAAVIGVPDRIWGEAVKALVTLRPGHTATAEDIIACVRAAKGPIHAPKSVQFVDSIPVTGLGKPDKKLLRERYAGDGSAAA
jgi:fatty-acyl-CoA synthase